MNFNKKNATNKSILSGEYVHSDQLRGSSTHKLKKSAILPTEYSTLGSVSRKIKAGVAKKRDSDSKNISVNEKS
jgi:hypothetical protein